MQIISNRSLQSLSLQNHRAYCKPPIARNKHSRTQKNILLSVNYKLCNIFSWLVMTKYFPLSLPLDIQGSIMHSTFLLLLSSFVYLVHLRQKCSFFGQIKIPREILLLQILHLWPVEFVDSKVGYGRLKAFLSWFLIMSHCTWYYIRASCFFLNEIWVSDP